MKDQVLKLTVPGVGQYTIGPALTEVVNFINAQEATLRARLLRLNTDRYDMSGQTVFFNEMTINDNRLSLEAWLASKGVIV